MNMNTKYFGNIEVTESDKIIFPKGLFGFEENKAFYLFPFEDSEGTLLCLQSAEEPYLAFVLINPYHIMDEYHPLLTDEDLNDIEAQIDSSIAYYVIAVVHEKFQESTVNLKCPIIINLDKNMAKQAMLENSAYSFRHPIVEQDKGE